MENTVGIGVAARRVVDAAVGAGTRSGRVGTEHLLVGLCNPGGGAAAGVLAEFEVTLVTAMNAVRADRWTTDEGGPDPAAALGGLETLGNRPVPWTASARRALAQAFDNADGRGVLGADDLLRGVLAGRNRATELLAAHGASAEAVLDRLAGGDAPSGPDVDEDLRPTRDVLLGVARYPGGSFMQRLTQGMMQAVGGNLAATPVSWIGMDARDQAHRLGHAKARTAHALLAVLATSEVLRDLPHLAGEPAARWAGARALAEAGATYAAARAVVAGDPPGRDPRRFASYVDGKRDTGELLDALLTGDTSAAKVLRALDVRFSAR